MKKALALLLAMLLMLGLLAGCGGGGEETSTEPGSTDGDSVTPPSYEALDPNEGSEGVTVDLPLVDDVYTFEWWNSNPDTFENFAGMQDNTFYQWMEEQTNVHIEFNHPAGGSETESFQTMVLSNDYPDFLGNIRNYYSGGVDKAIADNVLLALNDYIDLMPNYKRFVYETEQAFIQAVSDEGNLWGIHHIVDRPQGSWIGLCVRQDWLDEAGIPLETAETIDGLEEILTTFTNDFTYENQGALWLGYSSATTSSSAIIGSYNVGSTSVVPILNIDNTAYYSPLQPGYKEYAAKMADWYAKGLINKNYIAEASWSTPQDYWVNSQMGVGEIMYTQNLMYAEAAKVSDLQPDPDFALSAISSPKLDASDDWSDIHLRNTQSKIRPGSSLGISTQCSNKELACAYWNYAWSDEGIISANWGQIEGEYGDVNAHYYIDETDANGDGHTYCYQPAALDACGTVSRVQCKHAVYNGPVYCIWSREWCVLTPEQIEMTKIWDRVDDSYCWPEGVTLTTDEGDRASSILTNCNTAAVEWLAAVITGEKSVDTWDTELVPTIQSMNIQEALDCYQAALNRYNARIQYMDD